VSPAATSAEPLFTILCAAYNAAGTIGRTIASVLAQDDGDWRLIVIDDGSTDDTAALARSAAGGDPRVEVITQANAGCGAARNTGAAASRSEFLCVLDADDAYLPGYLSSMRRLIGHYPDRDIYSCNGIFVLPSGLRVPIRKGPAWQRELEVTADDMIDESRIFIECVIRRSAFERAGGFRRRIVEDFDLWTRVLLNGGRHIYTPEKLGLYYVTGGSLSKNLDAIQRARLEVLHQLAEDYPHIRGAHFDASVAKQEGLIEFAMVERRIASGEYAGARAAFFRAWRFHRTWARKLVGALTMTLHPALYRRVFLGQMYPDARSDRS